MKRLLWLSILLIGAIALAGLGIYFLKIGLDKSDKAASTLGIFVSILSLAVAVYGTISTRGSGKRPTAKQAVASSSVGGHVIQASGVRGNVTAKLRSSQPTPPDAGRAPLKEADESRLQSIKDSTVGGSVAQFQDIGGDMELGQ